jgi:hypothetical protein
MRWIVAVQHGRGTTRWEAELNRLAHTHSCQVIRVDTANVGLHGPNANDAFEFSGYQVGLQSVLEQTARATDKGLASESHTLVFLNDTAFQSHVQRLVDALVTTAFNRACAELNPIKPIARGIEQHFAKAGFPGRQDGSYLSTWAFSLVGTTLDLQKVKFYNHDETSERFDKVVAPALAADYRLAVQHWLQPNHPLKGWYKAIPGAPVDRRTMQRKRQTIYLEHVLATRLDQLGFAVQALGDEKAFGQRALHQGLMALDRVNTNVLKLRHRWQHRSGRQRPQGDQR